MNWQTAASLLLAALGFLGLTGCNFKDDAQAVQRPAAPPDVGLDDLLAAQADLEGSFLFTLEILRLVEISHQETSGAIEEFAQVQVLGDGEHVIGYGSGPAQMVNFIAEPCEVSCDYEMAFEVKGRFQPPPTCELVLTITPDPKPGECTTPCASFAIPWPGVTDTNIDPVIFYPEEIGFHDFTYEETTLSEELGNMRWVNSFKVIDLKGSPSVPGCTFDF